MVNPIGQEGIQSVGGMEHETKNIASAIHWNMSELGHTQRREFRDYK